MRNWLKILFSVLFISFISQKIFSQDYVLNYQHLQTKDGLANAFVNCALQDNEGFMWFGTKDGLCRYDGKNFLTFRNDEEDSIFLSSNSVQAICQSEERYLLIGTTTGLSKLDLYTQKISTIDFFSKKNILSILIDTQKTIWIIADNQLFFKNQNQKKWEEYSKYTGKDNPEFDKKVILGICEKSIDRQNYLVISEQLENPSLTILQLSYRKLGEKKWTKISKTPFLAAHFDKNNIWLFSTKKTKKFPHLHQIYDTTIFKINVLENSFDGLEKFGLPFYSSVQYKEKLYSYNAEGILIIDTQSKKISQFIDWSKTKLNTEKYRIIGIYADKMDNLWVYTYGAGIAMVPMYTLFSLKEYKFQENNLTKGLSGLSVRTMYQDDSTKNIWVATYNEKRKIDIFTPKKHKQTILCEYFPYSFRKKIDTKNDLWLGTYNGLQKIDTRNNSIKNSSNFTAQINSLLPLNDSTIWLSESYLLQKYNPITQKKTIYSEYGKVNCLYLDKNNKIWVGSLTDGIALLDTNQNPKQKTPVFYNPKQSSKNTNCQVMAIYQDSKNLFWLSTTNGIYSFDEKTKEFKNYNKKNGLPNNIVYAALEDENYNLWLSTNNGISKFDIEKETFENYDESDGLQNNEFNQKAYFKNAEGELFFGGINGMNTFFPKDMERNTFVPPLYFTKITKQDSTIKFDKPLHQIEELKLPIDEAQILSFSFVTLNYYRPEKNQYAYKIDELQNDWINLGNEGKLTLTGLAHGNYTLRIKAANNHELWNEDGIILKLVLVPPFYLKNWFFVLSALFFIGIGYLFFRLRIYQLKQQEQILERKIKERTQELAQANRTKNQLFAIIAHDLKSPIVAFQSVAKQINFFLRKDKPERLKEISSQIEISSENLSSLLNNLLNWALTQQNNTIQIKKERLSVNQSVEQVFQTYQIIATANHISLENTISEDIFGYVDKDCFQTILRNLISNALKYTPEGGKIITSAIHQKDTVLLKVSDTGIGMSEKFREEIFQLNFAQTSRGIRGEKGTGLGLVLCYEFATLNNIKIDVETEEGQGTTFLLTIPTK